MDVGMDIDRLDIATDSQVGEERENIAAESGNSTVAVEVLQDEVSRGYLFVKRCFDIVCSLSALVVLSPILLLIALAVFLDDPKGSPFFVQTRVGKDGKEFQFYKFRSMVVNAEDLLEDLLEYNETDGCAFKIKRDPRITRVGRFIRKTSLDELPQLVNIFKGDMSIVGPRPPLPREVAEYTEHYRQRLRVRPGLTCIWQVTPKRHDLPFEQWIELDLQYIRERSVALDLKLIFQTFWVIFSAGNE
jgi:lipopolysaccharide/colanic/teichoic acid biosynthesis glycosyltransferase